MTTACSPRAERTVVDVANSSNKSRNIVGKITLIIRFLGQKETPCGLAEIARGVCLAKTTAHRLLHTLEAERVVHRTSAGYELSDRDSTMGMAGDGHAVVRRHALKGMLSLYESTHMLVQLMVVEDRVVRCVDQFEPPGDSMLSRPIDFRRRWQAHQVAAGRAVLWSRRQESPTERVAPRIAFDDGMTHHKLFTAAVPIMIRGDRLAAISLSGPRMAVFRADIRERMSSIAYRCEHERGRWVS